MLACNLANRQTSIATIAGIDGVNLYRTFTIRTIRSKKFLFFGITAKTANNGLVLFQPAADQPAAGPQPLAETKKMAFRFQPAADQPLAETEPAQ